MRSIAGGGHSSGTPVAERLMRPTRAAARRSARCCERGLPRPLHHAAPTWSCSRWGFPCRRRCRQRGALLPHHFTLAARRVAPAGLAVCFLWHYPWGHPRRVLPGTAPPWSPDFPLPHRGGAAARPSGKVDVGVVVGVVKGDRQTTAKTRRFLFRGWSSPRPQRRIAVLPFRQRAD